jgi:hypothetical protein
MKIFISWSGETSHLVAKILRDWLPSVIQSVNPYVSSEDIDKGSRWSTDIAGELEESSYGILCVTKENINAPWLNFEAGALGKSVDKSRVSPFLFRVKRSEVNGPVLQFQSTIQEKEDIFKLIKSINNACDENALDDIRLEKVFNVWWPSLEEDLNKINENNLSQEQSKQKKKHLDDDFLSNVVEELLEISRTNQKLLRNPEQILPPEYFEYIMERRNPKINREHRLEGTDIVPEAIEDAIFTYRELLKAVSKSKSLFQSNSELEEILHFIRRMDRPMRHIGRGLGMRLPKDLLDDILI